MFPCRLRMKRLATNRHILHNEALNLILIILLSSIFQLLSNLGHDQTHILQLCLIKLIVFECESLILL